MSEVSSETESDDSPTGELVLGIKDGNVMIDFGAARRWIGFTPEDARRFGSTIIDMASQADGSLGTIPE